jgi:signal transduction histidine kinase
MAKDQHASEPPPHRTRATGRLPRLRLARTVRFRLTVLYGVLFFLSGAVLLAITGGITRTHVGVGMSQARNTAQSAPSAVAQLATAREQIQQLQQALAAQANVDQSNVSHALLEASLIGLGFMTVGSLAMGWVLAGRALRPVRQMTTAARQISAQNLNERLAVAGPQDELKELGDTFDGLLQRLEAAFTAQRRFVANASHELRTPLTTMRASVDVAVAKPEGAAPQTIVLASRLRAELDRVDSLLEAFLTLSRAQHGYLPGYAVLPLDYIVGAALADQSEAIRARNLTVQDTTGPGGAWVQGSQALLSRMAGNLIDNAVGHNTDGGWIAVTAETEGGWARLVVENGGEILDQQQVDELSQPFRRLGADRIGTDKGSGLGLSIVAAIVEAHHGQLSLRARADGGLRVCVDLPAAGPAGPPANARLPA